MNKRWFQMGLFKEGLRQTRLIALIGAVTILAFTGLIWLAVFAEEIGYGSVTTPTIYDFPVVGAVLIAQYCVFSPLMVLFLFRYLNRRESADFYHAIPHTREAIHISYLAAIEFWNLLTTIAVAGLIFLLYGLCPFMVINLSTVLPYLFNMIAAQLLVAASVLFAMSITGTAFTNVVVSLLVIFVPRLLLTVIGNMIQNCCMIADIFFQYPFLNPAMNVAAGLPISAFMSFSTGNDHQLMSCITNSWYGLYTLALAFITLTAALFLLHHRKSETAGKASPSRLLQAIYRITFGTVVGLLPVHLAYDSILWDNMGNTGSWIALLALTMGAALAYFLFELIATKKAKNLIRAIPGLVIFLAIDAILLSASFAVGRAILTFNPTAEEILSITITEDEDNYFANKSESIQLEDPACKKVAAKALSETISMVESGRVHRGTESIYGNYEESTVITMNFETQSGWQRRLVVMSYLDHQVLIDSLQQHKDYKDSYYDLPNPQDSNVVITIDGYSNPNNDEPLLSKAEQNQLYATFVEEVKAMPFELWYPIAIESNHGTMINSFASLTIQVAQGNQHYWMAFPIHESVFPKTTAQYLEKYCQIQPHILQNTQTLMDQLIEEDLSLYEDYDLYLSVYSPTEHYLDIPDAILPKLTQEILAKAKPAELDSEDVLLGISLHSYSDSAFARQLVLLSVEPEVLEGYLFAFEETVIE